jgi:pyrroloquinoline quinone biosynthesis protein B
MRRLFLGIVLGLLVPPLVRAEAVDAPFVRVLGIAQDGGVPHAGCTCERCEHAREHGDIYVASLAIVIPEKNRNRIVIVDATPDMAEQLTLLADVRDAPDGRVDRKPVDGVILTHAHMGHYLGLADFGFEVMHSPGVDVYCTPRMAGFLRGNAPWSKLVEFGEIVINEIDPHGRFDLGGGVSVELFNVPHRDELSDTVAVRIEGPSQTILYVPDTDGWDAWNPSLTEQLIGVDVALLDGSFYSMDELPGRSIEQVRHPLITQTMALLQPIVDEDAVRVIFTHLNHTNPALLQRDARDEINRRGFGVAEVMLRLDL